MHVQLTVGPVRFTTRGMLASLSLVAATSIVGGSLLRAEPDEFAAESSPVVLLRAKPSMSRQPRPSSAPLRHLDQRADAAVVLLGIEAVDEPDGADSANGAGTSTLSMGEWTPLR